MCGTVVLDLSPEVLHHRLANKVYELCRSSALKLPGFPSYDSIIQALRSPEGQEKEEKCEVCVRRHDRLLVLQGLAEKWLHHEEFAEETRLLIQDHNARFNDGDGEFWAEEETDRTDIAKLKAST